MPLTRPTRFLWALLGLTLSGCSASAIVELGFKSQPIHSVVRRIDVTLFGEDESGPPPSCASLDPRGQPPGDARTRAKREPAFQAQGQLGDPIVSFDSVPSGAYALAIEAVGPACETVKGHGADEEPTCERLVPGDPTVLRAYACSDIQLKGGKSLELATPLETFASIGSTIEVPIEFPVNASAFEQSAPLFAVEGLAAIEKFYVRLLDSNSDDVDGVKVNFSLVQGVGGFLDEQPAESGLDPIIQDNGLASATLRAGFEGSRVNNGLIEVIAHAPGYEGSPIHFFARAVPNVRFQSSLIPGPPGINLATAHDQLQPVVVEDMDGDGHLDVITSAGYDPHRIIVFYGAADQTFSAHASAEQLGQLRAIQPAVLEVGRKTLVVGTADEFGITMDTPGGRTTVIQSPDLRLWQGLDIQPLGTALDPTITTITELESNPNTPIVMGAATMDAADLDGDGIDELAVSECTYLHAEAGGQRGTVICYGGINDDGDSQVEILRQLPDAFGHFESIATVQSEGNDGGYGEVRFADSSGDGSLDLLIATNSKAVGVCGRRNQPGTGFGFAVNPKFDETITFGNGFSLATGKFDDDDRADVVAGGPFRASSAVAGVKLLPGGNCDFDAGPPAVPSGPRTYHDQLLVRTADLNGDGWDDVLVLHKDQRLLRTFLGGGKDGLAEGPVIAIPTRQVGSFDVGVEMIDGKKVAVAAILLREESALWVLRFGRDD